jgi:hypothetical protein
MLSLTTKRPRVMPGALRRPGKAQSLAFIYTRKRKFSTKDAVGVMTVMTTSTSRRLSSISNRRRQQVVRHRWHRPASPDLPGWPAGRALRFASCSCGGNVEELEGRLLTKIGGRPRPYWPAPEPSEED